MLNMKI